MKRYRLAHVPTLVVILALVSMSFGAAVAVSQDDCTNECHGGIWDSASQTCDVGTHVNCSHCEVVCGDGGGDSGPGEPHQDNP